MLKKVVLLFALLAVAAVPLARAVDDPGTIGQTETGTPTIGDTTSVPATSTDPATTATTPAATTPTNGVVPDGVTIAGVDVGGMTSTAATEAVVAAFDQPLQFTYKKRKWWANPDRLGAKAYVAGAVGRALTSAPGASVDLVVTVKGEAVRDYVDYLKRNFDRSAKNAELRLVALRPRLSKPRDGFTIDTAGMTASIVRALKQGERGPLPLRGSVSKPTVTLKNFGPVIVIRRGSNELYLYKGQKFWRKFRVATGQSAYPTPVGNFDIVNMQRNPWWYPPPESDWAKDAEPIPPGPGNPLGTRWMGLSAPLVGIHGTPDAASIGYSASHGCIRMLVSDAEWLFDHVGIGTPVFIRAA